MGTKPQVEKSWLVINGIRISVVYNCSGWYLQTRSGFLQTQAVQADFSTIGLCQPNRALGRALALVLSHRVKARFGKGGQICLGPQYKGAKIWNQAEIQISFLYQEGRFEKF